MSGNSSKMVLNAVLVISLLKGKPFNVGARLLKISMRSYPFIVVMTTRSVRHGAMATTLATSPDDILFSLPLLTAMKGGSFISYLRSAVPRCKCFIHSSSLFTTIYCQSASSHPASYQTTSTKP